MNRTATASAEAIRRTLEVLHPPGSVFEIRSLGIPGRGRPHSAAGYFDDLDAAAQAADEFENRNPAAIYTLLNPCNPALLARSPNQITVFLEPTTSDRDILARRWLLLDFDPERPAGISSTEAELNAARSLASIAMERLDGELGWPAPVQGMSGNGWHLLYRIDLPNDEQTAAMVARVLAGIGAEIELHNEPGDPVVKVDRAVFNAARITKLLGTITRKGHHLDERPHRRSGLIYVPDELEVVTRDQLAKTALWAPEPEPPTNGRAHHHQNGSRTSDGPRLDVARWLTDRGWRFTVKDRPSSEGLTVYLLAECPFNPEHGRHGEVAVTQAPNGRLGASCKHQSCQGKDWAAFREKIGNPDPDHWDPPLRARARTEQSPREPNPEPEQHAPPKPIRIADLIQEFPTMSPIIIDCLLRRGETANIIAPPKIGKTWLTYGLALAVASGEHWLGRFACTPGRVLIIDNELHPETIAHRIPAVAEALGLRLQDYQDNLDVLSLRGRLTDLYGLEPIVRSLAGAKYQLVIGDAWYRFVPSGVSENDNAGVMKLYNELDRYVADLGAGWVGVHHTSRGSQSEKSVTDTGAGAGSQSRAADSHIVLRPHEEEGVFVLEAAVRSFEPAEPLPLRWTFPTWTPAEDVDPTKLKGRRPRNEEEQIRRDAETDAAVLDHAGPWRSLSELERLTGFGPGRLKRSFARLKSAGYLEEGAETRNHNQCVVYRKTIHAR